MKIIKVSFILLFASLLSCNSSTDGYEGEWKGLFFYRGEVQFTVKKIDNCLLLEGELSGVFVYTKDKIFASNENDVAVLLYDKSEDILIITFRSLNKDAKNFYFTRVKTKTK